MSFAPIPSDKTREIYYRVTGRPIEAEPAPRVGAALPGRRHQDDARWDVNQGGDQVGVIALARPRAAPARASTDRSTRAPPSPTSSGRSSCKNDAPVQREARAELALPPGGVVSRVTLWIDGAGARGGVRRARRSRGAPTSVWCGARRDPILVTASAPDRILVQCFPVQPNGGVMKARIGITAPLQLGGAWGRHAGPALLHAAELRRPGRRHARRLDREQGRVRAARAAAGARAGHGR